MSIHSSIRLNKFISESGICSRREADRFIEQGNVYINGKRAVVGDQVYVGDKVKVNGQSIEPREADDIVFIALNKPVGVVSTTEDGEKNNIIDFINHSKRIFPIGRLDKDSQGLIFLTNNGDLVNKILRSGNNHEKEYLVTVNKPISNEFIDGMRNGIPMLGVTTKKCKVEKVAPMIFSIVLIQGLNRQIRRMCEYFNYEVVKLERTRIMNISLKGLPVGEWRDLDEKELAMVLKDTADSTSDASASGNRTRRKPTNHGRVYAEALEAASKTKTRNSNHRTSGKAPASKNPTHKKPTAKVPQQRRRRGEARP